LNKYITAEEGMQVEHDLLLPPQLVPLVPPNYQNNRLHLQHAYSSSTNHQSAEQRNPSTQRNPRSSNQPNRCREPSQTTCAAACENCKGQTRAISQRAHGAGEMFRVTTVNTDDVASLRMERSFLVSITERILWTSCILDGFWSLENTCLCTRRCLYLWTYLAEFLMVEPEMAFADMTSAMNNAESMPKAENCDEDLEFFAKFVEKVFKDRLLRSS
ncbi:LOW QUALITY PROTEIN: hypothetical protein ACHAXN_004957, partial [Cyclotella atomus]